MKDFSVSVVITNFNGREILAKNLPSVVEAKKIVSNRIREIIVVDDASIDDSVSFLKKNFPEVRVIAHRKNRGYSAAVNTGVRLAKGNLVCILNNDVFVTKDFLKEVFDVFAKNPKCFGVSLNEEGYGPAVGFFENGFVGHSPRKKTKGVTPTFWVNGGSGVFRRDLWMRVGWFDEELFSPFYWEDIDLSYRALKRGYEIFWHPGAKVIHNHETTIGRINKKYKERIQERNQLLFIWKNITSRRLFIRHLVGLFNRIIRHPGYLVIVFMALSKIKRVIKARRREQKEGIVADEFIFSSFKQ